MKKGGSKLEVVDAYQALANELDRIPKDMFKKWEESLDPFAAGISGFHEDVPEPIGKINKKVEAWKKTHCKGKMVGSKFGGTRAKSIVKLQEKVDHPSTREKILDKLDAAVTEAKEIERSISGEAPQREVLNNKIKDLEGAITAKRGSGSLPRPGSIAGEGGGAAAVAAAVTGGAKKAEI
jgi:hypothetical protein